MSRSVNFDGLTRDAGDPGPGDLVRERLDIQRFMHREKLDQPAPPVLESLYPPETLTANSVSLALKALPADRSVSPVRSA